MRLLLKSFVQLLAIYLIGIVALLVYEYLTYNCTTVILHIAECTTNGGWFEMIGWAELWLIWVFGFPIVAILVLIIDAVKIFISRKFSNQEK